MNSDTIKKIRRTANWGLYGSIAFILLAIAFLFSPWTLRQTQTVSRWMLIAGTILAVLSVVMVLMTIRKNTPRLRQLDSLEEKLKGYAAHISNIYTGSATIILFETALIVLMSDTSLLMITILLVLILFLSYPNMYKMKIDLGLSDEEMKSLFGSAYISDTPDAQPDLDTADALLERDSEQSQDATDNNQE